MNAVATPSTSAFTRRPDKRLVRQVALHSPGHWVPMNIGAVECKLMEIRKYSAAYHEVNSKFRKKNLELISAYAVQNPYLYGYHMLRKEQLKMQLARLTPVRERSVYYPTTFADLEPILKDGFRNPHSGTDDDSPVAFFTDSNLASKASQGNPKVMVVARVLLGVCQVLPGQGAAGSKILSKRSRGYGFKTVDTFVSESRTLLFKTNPNEMYPETVLVYRDKEGPPDSRSSRIAPDLNATGTVTISYRTGTRYNPDEGNLEVKPSSSKASVTGSKGVMNREASNFKANSKAEADMEEENMEMVMVVAAEVHPQEGLEEPQARSRWMKKVFGSRKD